MLCWGWSRDGGCWGWEGTSVTSSLAASTRFLEQPIPVPPHTLCEDLPPKSSIPGHFSQIQGARQWGQCSRTQRLTAESNEKQPSLCPGTNCLYSKPSQQPWHGWARGGGESKRNGEKNKYISTEQSAGFEGHLCQKVVNKVSN